MSSKHAKLDSAKPKEPAEPDFRMVLVGKTGGGKSASGNTILGRRAFKSELSPSTVTLKCQKEEGKFEGKRLAVVDTPGLFGTKKTEKEIAEEILQCISHIAPGPHVFLVVIQLNRFTKEEQQTIQTMFGEEAARYTMVLFTHGDDLEAEGVTMKEFLDTNKELRDFIRQYGGRYHVFNNRNQNPSQVRELLEKITIMVLRNGGRFYTSKMLEEVERKNMFIMGVLAALGGVGGVAGGLMGGPVGAAIGACVGLGLAVAAITAARKKRKCVLQ